MLCLSHQLRPACAVVLFIHQCLQGYRAPPLLLATCSPERHLLLGLVSLLCETCQDFPLWTPQQSVCAFIPFILLFSMSVSLSVKWANSRNHRQGIVGGANGLVVAGLRRRLPTIHSSGQSLRSAEPGQAWD